jgi:hypothetical protein
MFIVSISRRSAMPEHRSIGELAYRIWQARGCPEGSAEQDWLDAEKQLMSAQRAATAQYAAEPTASQDIDRSLQDTFPASDPPASHRPDDPPVNADAKWKAAGLSRTSAAAPPRRSKSAQNNPNAESKPSAKSRPTAGPKASPEPPR